MHRDVGALLRQRVLQLLHEQALAADLGQRDAQHLVALGRHPQDLDLQTRIQLEQPVTDVVSLPQRQGALARGNGESSGNHAAGSGRANSQPRIARGSYTAAAETVRALSGSPPPPHVCDRSRPHAPPSSCSPSCFRSSVNAQAQPAADKPIATVNGVPVKPTLFQQALQQALAQGQPDSPQLREAITSQLIARELLIQAAAKQGWTRTPRSRRSPRRPSAPR